MSITPPRLSEHFDDLTQIKVEGAGLFDELMQAVKAHLQEEYDKQRIRGAEYTQAYIASMQAAMGNAVQYLIGMRLIDAEMEKLKADTEQALAQTKLINEQTRQQKYITDVRLPAEVALTQEQVKQAGAQTAQIAEQTKLIIAQTATEDRLREQRFNELREKVELARQQTQMVFAQIESEKYKRKELMPAEKAQINATVKKIETEISLIKAKKDEQVKQLQVMDTQMELYREQAKAYDREIEVKLAKIRADAWGAKIVVSENTSGGPNTWAK